MAIFIELLLVAMLSVWIIVLCLRCALVVRSLRRMAHQRHLINAGERSDV
jgi:hypothetical protein